MKKSKNKKLFPLQAFVRVTAFIPLALILKLKIQYEKGMSKNDIPDGGFIIVANHTSMLDIAVISFYLGLRQIRVWAADILYTKSSLFSFFLKHIGCIYVNRQQPDFSSVTSACEALTQDDVMIVFPEGGYTGNNTNRPFRPGALILAVHSDIKMVPVFLTGEYGLFKRAGMNIGKPITAKDFDGLDDNTAYKENMLKACTVLKNKVYSLKDIKT